MNFYSVIIVNKKMQALKIPVVFFGTSSLKNLFVALGESVKFKLVKKCIHKINEIPTEFLTIVGAINLLLFRKYEIKDETEEK